MRTPLLLLALATAAESWSGSSDRTAPASSPADVIQMHLGVPGVVYIGQPLTEFLARFPDARSTPVAGQPDIVRVQVQAEGISCLAMGGTPPAMTLESIGFNFGAPYEGVSPGKRRTLEGIGRGSTVNDLLGTYGPPSETSTERPPGAAARRRPRPNDPEATVRHVYRSADGAVATYFVVQGYEVVRMAIGRRAEIEKHLSGKPATGERSGSGATGQPPDPAPVAPDGPAGP